MKMLIAVTTVAGSSYKGQFEAADFATFVFNCRLDGLVGGPGWVVPWHGVASFLMLANDDAAQRTQTTADQVAGAIAAGMPLGTLGQA